MNRTVALFSLLFVSLSLTAGGLDKAKLFQANGLSEDAKRELIEVVASTNESSVNRAEALVLLGDIALQQGKSDLATSNWNQAIALYPITAGAAIAKARLANASVSPSSAAPSASLRDVALLVADQKYPWAAAQIGAALKSPTTLYRGSLLDALNSARAGQAKGVVEVQLSTDSAFESGRVVCYSSIGQKVWEEKVMFNIGGGEERIARRFTDSLAKKVSDRHCP